MTQQTTMEYPGLSPERYGQIDLISRYMTGEMNTDEARDFEKRLFTDHEFFGAVEPLIAVWTMPVDWNARPDERAATEKPATATAYDPDVIGTINAKRVREPAFAYAFEAPQQQPLVEKEKEQEKKKGKADQPWDVIIMDFLMERGWTMTKLAVAVWMLVAIPFVYSLRFIETPHPTITVIQEPVPATVIPGSTLVESKGESYAFTLPNGSRAMLRPGARFWYKTMAMVGGTTATLQGELALELTKDDKRMMLNTAVGKVMLMPGMYAVRCNASCTVMLVTVGASGFAFMTAPDSAKGSVTLLKHEKGALRAGGSPEKITGPGDGSADWPVLLPPLAGAKP